MKVNRDRLQRDPLRELVTPQHPELWAMPRNIPMKNARAGVWPDEYGLDLLLTVEEDHLQFEPVVESRRYKVMRGVVVAVFLVIAAACGVALGG